MKKKGRSYLFSWLLSSAMASTAFAGEGAGSSNDANNAALPEVLVTGDREPYNPQSSSLPKYNQPLFDTPQSITVIPQQVIQDQGLTTMRDVLRGVSGISIAAGEGSSQGDNLTIRGFTARSDFFLDGMRDFGSYYRDPFNMEQVEVLQGPAGVMFGRGSTGGAIEQESKTAGLTPKNDVSFMVGSDDTRRVTADINQPMPELGQHAAFRVNVMGDEGGVAGRDEAKNSRYGFAPTLSLGLDTPDRLTISYFHQSESDIPDYGVPWLYGRPADVPHANFYGFSSDYLRTDADVVTAKGEHDVNDSLTLRDQLRFANYARDARITEPQIMTTTVSGAPVTPSTPLSQLQVNRNEITVDSVETSLQNQADATGKFDTGPIRHTLTAGIEADHETSDPTRQTITGVPTTSLLDPDEGQPFSGTSTISSDVQATVDTVGFYTLDTMKLGELWELLGGVRWDHAYSFYLQSVPGSTQGQFSRVDQMATWRGALVFHPLPNGSIYFAAGTSFDPSAEQLSLSATTASLPPETTRSYELGSKWDILDGRLSLSGALFSTEMFNARETDPSNPLLDFLSGTELARGIQLGIRGALTDKLEVFSGYTYLNSKVVTSVNPGEVGLPLSNAPDNTFDFWGTYKLPKDVQIGAGVDAVSGRSSSVTPSTTLIESGYIGWAPGYAIFNAMIKQQVTKRLSVQMSVLNLADAFYYDGIHPGHVIPGASRTFLFNTAYKF